MAHEKLVIKVGGMAAHTCADAMPQPGEILCWPKTALQLGERYSNQISQRLNDAVLDIASETKTLLFHRSQPSPIPAYTMTELWLGNAALDLAAEEIGGLFPELMRRSPG